MIIDGHCHIEGDYHHILSRMDALNITRTVLVGVGVSDLSVVTIRDSFVFRHQLLLNTLGVMKARSLVRSRKLRSVLLGKPMNDRVLDAIKARPDRFSGFAFVNPEGDGALDEMCRCLDAGMRGVKLALLQYPTDLSGARMSAICEIAAQRAVPVFFHVGVTPESADARQMVHNFPNVTFIIAHAGVQRFSDAMELAKTRDNVYIDTSSYIVPSWKLEVLYRTLGAEKLVFGSDYPVMALDPEEGLTKVNALRAPDGDKEKILGLNMMRLLGQTS